MTVHNSKIEYNRIFIHQVHTDLIFIRTVANWLYNIGQELYFGENMPEKVSIVEYTKYRDTTIMIVHAIVQVGKNLTVLVNTNLLGLSLYKGSAFRILGNVKK